MSTGLLSIFIFSFCVWSIRGYQHFKIRKLTATVGDGGVDARRGGQLGVGRVMGKGRGSGRFECKQTMTSF